MENLIASNIRSRPTRAAISVLAVALGVVLLLVIGGITTGTLNDYLNRTISIGSDFILQKEGATALFAFSSANLNTKLAEKIRQVPGVQIVSPVLAKAEKLGVVFGIDPASFNEFPGGLKIIDGSGSLRGFEVVVDKYYADANRLKPGMAHTLQGDHEFTVTGVCRPGTAVRIFLPLETLQELNGSPGKVSMMFIKADSGADLDRIQSLLEEAFPGYSIMRSDDPKSLLANMHLPGLKEFRITIVAISMLLSFMVILLAMYTTIFERTREIGILKSLGASRGFIVGIIMKESAIICCLGAVVGIGISEIIRGLIMKQFPLLQVAMGPRELTIGLVLGVLAGILGAIYPAYKAAKMDPVRALSYE
ncbi:MAG: ABC transporter permease [Acidobacteria bacterium]|nr:ABC transporter permease [Acidobacteriota bacterium]